MSEHIVTEQSGALSGEVSLYGAKNSTLALMASLVLTQGVSTLRNVPASSDVLQMIELLRDLGAQVTFEDHVLVVDTRPINSYQVRPEIMKKMRASILAMGPLLARFGKARVAFPGGCLIGTRPIDFHLKGFRAMGVQIEEEGSFLQAHTSSVYAVEHSRIVLEYPSVGATENLMMFAALGSGTTTIVNAALEPEVLDLIEVLRGMGAQISIEPVAAIRIEGVQVLQPIDREVIPDRLEAGTIMLACSILGGQVSLTNARESDMELFLSKLREMGHGITVGEGGTGITIMASPAPRSVDIKTYPHPGFPTDLQAPMITAQALANGVSIIEETVFENRMMHVKELQKMGAQISLEGSKATIRGVDVLHGADVVATDIRASSSLVLAGLAAEDQTTITGVHHWRRGYDKLEDKLARLGAKIKVV